MVESERRRITASWKFDLLETVAADPACNGADVEIVLAYLKFTDEPEGKVFCSNDHLAVATGLGRSTIIERRQHMQGLGYLVQAGGTKAGVPFFRLVNARDNAVLDHVAIAREERRERAARRKEKERRKLRLEPTRNTPAAGRQGGPKSGPPAEVKGTEIWTPRGPDSGPNYVESTRREDLLYEEEGYREVVNTRGEAGPADDERPDVPDAPYPAPASEDNLEKMLADLFDGCRLSPNLLTAMRKMLMAGRLTPAIVAHQREVAA